MNGPEEDTKRPNAEHPSENEEAGREQPAPESDHADALEAYAVENQSGEADLQDQIADLEGQLLRSQAELDNFRKRTRREMEAERKYAAMPLLKDLVGVIDNLRRALQAAENSGEAADLTTGVKMVAGEFERVLGAYGCSPFGAVGDTFDPNFHEAIAQQPSDEHAAGIVILVHQAGYQLHERVIRPAQVIVSSGPAA